MYLLCALHNSRHHDRGNVGYNRPAVFVNQSLKEHIRIRLEEEAGLLQLTYNRCLITPKGNYLYGHYINTKETKTVRLSWSSMIISREATVSLMPQNGRKHRGRVSGRIKGFPRPLLLCSLGCELTDIRVFTTDVPVL